MVDEREEGWGLRGEGGAQEAGGFEGGAGAGAYPEGRAEPGGGACPTRTGDSRVGRARNLMERGGGYGGGGGRAGGWPAAVTEGTATVVTGEVVREVARLLGEAERGHPLQEVMGREKVRLRRGPDGYAVANCPGARHALRSPTLEVKLSRPDHFVCRACGAGGDVFDFAGLVHGVATLSEQFRMVTGRVLASDASPEYAVAVERAGRFRKEEVLGEAPPAGAIVPVYEALLDRLPVSEETFQLVRRHYGLSEEEFLAVWPAHRYRTLPAGVAERVAVCDELIDAGYELRGVPGFFRVPDDSPDREARGRWCVGGDARGRRAVGTGDERVELGGLVVPALDPSGRVVNIEVHNDAPPRAAPTRLHALWPPGRDGLAGPHSGAHGATGAPASTSPPHHAGSGRDL